MYFSAYRRGAALVVAATAVLGLTACGASNSSEAVIQPTQLAQNSVYKGDYLGAQFAKPNITLTDTSGKPFNLVQRTAGKAVLLYFGYTKCPDVCPTTMGDIAVAIQKLPKSVQQQIDVVFVSTDPQQDTPPVLRAWLNSFNPNFIGLTGDFSAIQKAALSVGVYVEAPVKNADGSVTSTHGAQVLAYFPSDNKAHVLYTSGVSSADYAHDLPFIVKSVVAS